ncbi:MAG TPA: flagellar basal body L-ring protein [Desulfonatronum sp.]|nr:flagellar basal body L-ring protein [Desulfonatronum sp.]
MHIFPQPKQNDLVSAILTLGLLVGAYACAPATTQSVPTPLLTQGVEIPPPAEQNPGSLFNPASAEMLFADNRARRVGDIVMINIVENSQATNKATTDASRDSSIGMGIEHLLDQRLINMGLSGLGVDRDNFGDTPLIRASSTSEFKGDGETKRESTITATVGARVVRVLQGGVLQVEGAREIRVNNETQIIVVRGLVRSTDIDQDNTIPSTHMADATIEFYGMGILADKQRPGWLTRILENVWPF